MKYNPDFFILCLTTVVITAFGCNSYRPLDGDILFQTSLSNQSTAIQRATKSPYSHMGIVYIKEGKAFVYEASGTVSITPFREFVRRGENKRYVVKRLKKHREILTTEALRKMKKAGQEYLGKPYDLFFEWSDERIYCSELVWKLYERSTGLKIGTLKPLKTFNLADPVVREKLKERYGNVIPENEKVISPESMFDSELLETVFSN